MEGPSKKAAEAKKPEESGKPKKLTFDAAVINVSSIAKAQAQDAADHRMTESKEDRSGSFLGRLGRRIWKHNLAQEYYRQKEMQIARKEIADSENIYAAESEDIDHVAHEQAMSAIMSRFTSEYEQETLRQEERETKMVMQNGPTNARIKNLVSSYAADPTMTPAAFAEERNRILSSLDEDYAKEGSLYADNLLSIATEVRNTVAHGTALKDLDFDINLTLGKARESLNSEAKMHTFDRVVEKMQNSKVGRFIANSPALLGIAAGTYSFAKVLGLSALRSNVAKLVTFGGAALVAGGVTAAKESARLERERNQDQRERAKGMKFDEDDMERRKEMQKSNYDTTPATQHIANLEAALSSARAGGLDQASISRLVSALADTEARISLGDSHRVDLISYSSSRSVETERAQIDLLRARLKVELRRQGVNDLPDRLSRASATNIDSLLHGEEGIEQRDRIFKKMKHRKVAGAAFKALVIGAGIGLAAQEIESAFDSSNTGIFEQGWNAIRGKNLSHGGHATAFEALRRWVAGGGDPRMPLGASHDVLINGSHLTLPEGTDLVKNPADGTFTLMRDSEPLAEHLTLSTGPDGNLTSDSQALLQEHGVRTSFGMINGTKVIDKEVTSAEYLKEHPGDAHGVHRKLWYDNDTPHPFDKNELRTHWGGARSTGINEKGDFVLSVQHMFPNGSYHHGLNADAQKLMHDGKLKVLFSLSRGTQHQPFELPIDANGNIVVPKGSNIAKLMFENRHGNAVFTGKFAEIAENRGVGADGAENVRILSTLVGKGKDMVHVTETIATHVPNVRIDVPDNLDFDPPFIFPFAAARPALERGEFAKHRNLPEVDPLLPVIPVSPVELGYYFGGKISPELAAEYKKSLSPTLKENPNANLNAGAEMERYLSSQEEGYRASLENFAKELGPMSPECKLSIAIPVAGHQEVDNIERTLSSYLHQTADEKSFEIVLFVNQPETDNEGSSIEGDGTLARIESFKGKHPELPIRVMHAVLPREQARMGYIRKALNDAITLRAEKRTGDKEVILVSNDADIRGIAPEYVENFVTKFEKEPNVDALMGQLDWDPEAYIRNPLVHIGTRFFQYMEFQYRKEGRGIPSSGANFAFKGSTYAAIGGYNPETNLAEDVDLGRRIKYAREGSTDHTPIGFGGARVSRLYTSARRAEKAVADGLSPSEQWDKGFSAFDDEVRKTNWAERSTAPDYNDPETVKELTEELQRILNRTIRVTNSWYGEGEVERRTKRALKWLGVNAVFTDPSTVKIVDASRLIAGLKDYEQDGMAMMARKTGE